MNLCEDVEQCGYVLYSFPVCGASFFSTSPGFTCLRAGFIFLTFFGAVTT